MDRITDSCFKSFIADFGLEKCKIDVQFEHFINYLFVSKYYPEIFESDSDAFDKTHTGGGGDEAIDGCLIIVNDRPIYSIEEAQEISKANRRLDVVYFFIQSKTSSSFDSGDMLKFKEGVKGFYNDKFVGHGKIAYIKSISDELFKSAAKFVVNPKCHLCYATTGVWKDDNGIKHVVEDTKAELIDTNLLSDVEYSIFDAAAIQKYYKQNTNAITKTVALERNVAFPNISGLREAYLGLISSRELVNLITNDDGDLLRGLFYENVRSYLGENAVNLEISQTLRNREIQSQFPMLNNGITIVAGDVKRTGDNFTLNDFQIVNGCQTCNVIYENRKCLKDDTYIPFKLICLTDGKVVNRVIRSTNRQTIVTDEAFETLRPFHKRLQDLYNTHNESDRIYYERRSGEYGRQNGENVPRHRVVSIASQLYCFVSVFKSQPHSIHRYYGNLLERDKNIFQDDDVLEMYYTSARLVNKIDHTLWNLNLGKQLNGYKYHIALLCRILSMGNNDLPQPTSHKMERLCSELIDDIEDDDCLKGLIIKSCDILEAVMSNQQSDYKDLLRRKEFTQEIIAEAIKRINEKQCNG